MARLACKFAVIKYIPSSIKQEVINVGIIIHSPKQREIIVRFLDHEPRIKHFVTDVQYAEFRAFRRHFSKHIKEIKNHFFDPIVDLSIENDEYLDNLQNSLKMPFILAKPEYIFVENCSETILDLYNTFVLDPDECRIKQKSLIKQVEERFFSAGIEQYIERGISIKSLPFDFHIEFGVHVGSNELDLLQPISLQDSIRENYKEGVFWNDTINRLKHDPDLTEWKFFAIIKPPRQPQKVGYSELVRSLKNSEKVEVINYNNNEFEQLIFNIKQHGKILNQV